MLSCMCVESNQKGLGNKKTFKSFSIAVFMVCSYMFFFIGNAGTVWAEEGIWVKDETNQLTSETIQMINNVNNNLFPEYELDPQVVVEVLHNIPEEYGSLDEYRNRRFEELGIGNSEYDSGLLFVIALNDHEFGIETGYGIEPIVRDIEVSQLLDDTAVYMQEYSETGSAESLNEAVSHVFREVSKLLLQNETGDLEVNRQEEAVLEVIDNVVRWVKIAVNALVLAYLFETLRYVLNVAKDKSTGKEISLSTVWSGYTVAMWALTLGIFRFLMFFLEMALEIAWYSSFSKGSSSDSKGGKFGGGRSGGGGSSSKW